MLFGKQAVLSSTSCLLRRSAVQWKRSLMLYSNVASRRHLLRCSRVADFGAVTQVQRITLPSMSLLSLRAKHDKPLNHTVNLTSSSDIDDKSIPDAFKESVITENDIFKQEGISRNRFGVLKATLIIIAGIYFGAWLAMIGAYVLEELEIFVDDDDEDD